MFYIIISECNRFVYAVESVIDLDHLLIGLVSSSSTTLHSAIGVEMLCHKEP